MSFKKFDGSTWQPITPKKLKGIPYTGTLPATLTGTKAGYLHRYKIYGNTEQTGTPTPENPIVPQECGELETTGAHAGQYKLSLASAGQGVDIYLTESQTTRRIKKLVLTGEENWSIEGADNFYTASVIAGAMAPTTVVCSHQVSIHEYYMAGVENVWISSTGRLNFTTNAVSHTASDFKAYLAAQYANGTPVTIWYVLETPTTGTLNEPLRKIGDYADTIDSTQTTAQIPTSANSTTISWAGEGLAPSEFDSVREWVDITTYTRVNGEWVADN